MRGDRAPQLLGRVDQPDPDCVGGLAARFVDRLQGHHDVGRRVDQVARAQELLACLQRVALAQADQLGEQFALEAPVVALEQARPVEGHPELIAVAARLLDLLVADRIGLVEQPEIAERDVVEAQRQADAGGHPQLRVGRHPQVALGFVHADLFQPLADRGRGFSLQDRGEPDRVDPVGMGAVGDRAEVAVVHPGRPVELRGERIDERLDVAHRPGCSRTSTPAAPGWIIG